MELLQLFPGQPVLSLSTVAIVSVVVLYFARKPAHRIIVSLSRAVHNGLRIAAHAVTQAEKRLVERNREVLLAQGREAAEHIIEREFERVDATLRRDMAEYPALQRQLSEAATRIDEDYQNSTEVPPSPPGWTKAVAAVAKIPSSDDPMVVDILRGINDSLVKAHENAIEEYRIQARERHQLLKTMLPYWRKLQQILGQVDKRVTSLLERSKTIDRHMDEYEQILKGSDKAIRTLSSSSMTQFFIAAFVLAIAVGGAVINFNLIARPMQEMVGGGSYLLGFKTANIAALVIILVEVAMGLFLMESLRITRLFPTIGALDDKMRIRMMWASFIMLLTLAGIEAGLAYMRELLSQDDAALVAGLLNNTQVIQDSSNRWITTAAQMGMGFILPFALTFVAIPLESFVQSSRTVVGIVGAALLRVLSVTFRVFGNIVRYAGTALTHLYDLLIFAPLWLEGLLGGRRHRPVSEAQPSEKVAKEIAPVARRDEERFDIGIGENTLGAGS